MAAVRPTYEDIVNAKVASAQKVLVDATFARCAVTTDVKEAFLTLEFASNMRAGLPDKHDTFTASLREQIPKFYVFLQANGWKNNASFKLSHERLGL